LSALALGNAESAYLTGLAATLSLAVQRILIEFRMIENKENSNEKVGLHKLFGQHITLTVTVTWWIGMHPRT